ncbi:PilN domain-containing protein [Flagellimonas pacifica]|uniref:General secretion pathway protein n=1 Tax=Flagellimonas pacifica TaxID=1247520 RepID=A0A285MWX6_9FLAO|nr:hypothetical protein [Allomuricauda parva]SNZ01699.1 hypothetical protein SAMN06265377_3541 [Allomuricauda parva]
MLERLKNIDIFNDRVFAVVGIVLGDPIRYRILLLEKEKDDLSILRSFKTDDFEEIKREVKTSIPIILNFSGRGVISKKVSAKGNYIKEVLFNGNPDDFYSYNLFQEVHNFVSICRREIIDQHINLFENAKYRAIDHSIGPFPAWLGKNMVQEDVLRLDSGELVFQNGNLVDYIRGSHESQPVKYNVGNDQLDGNEIVLLSSLLNQLYPSDKIAYEDELLSSNLREQKLKRMFDYCSVGTLALFLLALLGSYLLLHHYNGKYVEYEQRLYHFNDNYSQIKKMEEDLAGKQFIVENSGVLNKHFLSFYSNEVTKTVPDGILLSSLRVNPLLKRVKGNEPISIAPNTILIEGRTTNGFYLNQWVKKLKASSWANKIEILNLNKVDGNTDAFSLKIDIE